MRGSLAVSEAFFNHCQKPPTGEEFQMSKQIASTALLSVLAALSFPATHAMASVSCGGFFASGPAVCGMSEILGGSSLGPIIETPAPLLYQIGAASVEVGEGGAASGVGGLVHATGTFGAAHISVSSFSDYPPHPFLQSNVSARGQIGFIDGFTVGPNAVDVQFQISLNGLFTGMGRGEVVFNLEDVTAHSFVFNNYWVGVDKNAPSAVSTFDSILVANHSYAFNWSMFAEAQSGNNTYTTYGPSTTDLSHSGYLTIDVLTPNESLTFLSGTDYRSMTDAVPEASTWAMMILGFAGVGMMTYRRRKSAELAI
jgi:hypothetical protein